MNGGPGVPWNLDMNLSSAYTRVWPSASQQGTLNDVMGLRS